MYADGSVCLQLIISPRPGNWWNSWGSKQGLNALKYDDSLLQCLCLLLYSCTSISPLFLFLHSSFFLLFLLFLISPDAPKNLLYIFLFPLILSFHSNSSLSSFFSSDLPSSLSLLRCLKQQQTWWVTVSSTLVATLCWSGFPPQKTLSRTRNPASSYSCAPLLLPSYTHKRTFTQTHTHTHINVNIHLTNLIPRHTSRHTSSSGKYHRAKSSIHTHRKTYSLNSHSGKAPYPGATARGQVSHAHSGWDQYITEYDPRCFGNIHICW